MSKTINISIKERIFHTILFESFALLLTIPVALYFATQETNIIVKTLVIISLVATVWNYIFNVIFDKIFGTNRITRGLGLRIVHTVSFEIIFLILTVPYMAYMLEVGLWTAFLLDIGVVIFYLLYTLIFNWIYDILRVKIINIIDMS